MKPVPILIGAAVTIAALSFFGRLCCEDRGKAIAPDQSKIRQLKSQGWLPRALNVRTTGLRLKWDLDVNEACGSFDVVEPILTDTLHCRREKGKIFDFPGIETVLKRQCREHLSQRSGDVLVCGNHAFLTGFEDSRIIYALGFEKYSR